MHHEQFSQCPCTLSPFVTKSPPGLGKPSYFSSFLPFPFQKKVRPVQFFVCLFFFLFSFFFLLGSFVVKFSKGVTKRNLRHTHHTRLPHTQHAPHTHHTRHTRTTRGTRAPHVPHTDHTRHTRTTHTTGNLKNNNCFRFEV
jgi:hypothetical protein